MTTPSGTQPGDVDLEEQPGPQEPLLESGTLVDGKYVIQRALGRGGTGTVYEARHTTIGHRVALKIVNADRAQRPETLARFQREAQICGAIRHPNVGQIYDVGTHDGQPYMVLELHEGRSLADVLDESILPIPAVLQITLQVLSALGAVHEASVVHRDVKPDNAMLVRALNGDIVVKLVDFGISKLVTADIRERTLTREGSILGSPDYMAPEQLRGQDVDARTDLYAVGVLLYEAVTGRTPFDAENLSDLMVAILRDPVVPPIELRTDCPPELDALIMKALSREPDDRFQSAAEMARQLEQIRSTLRYTPGAAIPELRKSMPLRSDRATKMRRGRKRSAPPVATTQADPPSTSVSISADVVQPQAAASPSQQRPAILWLAVAAVVVLAGTAAFALRDDPAVIATPAVQAAPAPEPAAAAPEPAVVIEPIVVAAAPPASDAIDAASTVDEADKPEPSERAARTKRSRRGTPEPRDTEPAAAADPPASEPRPAEPAAYDVKEQLATASSAFVLGQMPRAKALYQQILERAPRQADAWRGLGLVSSRMGQQKDAAHAFERYLELRPNAPDAERIREQLEKVR